MFIDLPPLCLAAAAMLVLGVPMSMWNLENMAWAHTMVGPTVILSGLHTFQEVCVKPSADTDIWHTAMVENGFNLQ